MARAKTTSLDLEIATPSTPITLIVSSALDLARLGIPVGTNRPMHMG